MQMQKYSGRIEATNLVYYVLLPLCVAFYCFPCKQSLLQWRKNGLCATIILSAFITNNKTETAIYKLLIIYTEFN